MKKFEIFRYLKKWWILIALLSAAAGVFCLRYANNNQVYTAQSVIEYTFDQASEGKAPDGSGLDVSEIFSSTVVKSAVENLDSSTFSNFESTLGVDAIRSRGSVSEIIPEDVQKSQNAKIEDGKDYEEYHPTKYLVQFAAGSSQGAEYAREVLDAVLSSYFVVFSEKYVDQSLIPNNAVNALNDGYDYMEQAELINDSVNDILTQLNDKIAAAPEFQSARTGLTFEDLYDEYYFISQEEVPYLFSEILSSKLTKDKDVLLKKYQERIESYNITSDTDLAKVSAIEEVIESYSEKNKEGTLYYNDSSNGDQADKKNGNILDNIYEDANGSVKVDRTTVYDQLIFDYVSLQSESSKVLIDAAYCRYLIKTFEKSADSSVDQEAVGKSVTERVEKLVHSLNDLYEKLDVTLEEYNAYLGAKNVTILSSTGVTVKLNAKLYMMLGIVLFFVVGCTGAVVLGRLGDFVEYFLFTDSKLKMPNRAACDREISKYAKMLIMPNFCCVVMELANLNVLNQEHGRSTGDQILEEFGKYVKMVTAPYGKMAYNGGCQFMGFLEKCSYEELLTCVDTMERLVYEYNVEHPKMKMKCVIGYSESRTDNLHTIRELVKKAMGTRKEVVK